MQLKIHKTFESFVKNSKHLEKMLIFIEGENNIAPLKENVFRFLENDLSNLKCVILGMDPYPSTYIKGGKEIPVATGRAFEVGCVDKWTDKYRQTSLANIFKTLWYYKSGKILSIDELRKISKDEILYIKTSDWFDAMEDAGVMFLNASLTTKIGVSGVHTEIWEDFVDELIKYLVKEAGGIKWLIWGKNALDRVTGLVDEKDIVYTCHPATRMNNTFIEDCVFKHISGIKWF